jgi:hypothetical protein
MSAIQSLEKPNAFNLKVGVRMIAGAAIGALFGIAVAKLAVLLHVPVKSFAWPDTLALTLGVACSGIGFITWLISFNRKEVARNLEHAEAPLPATNAEIGSVRLQAAVLFLAGVMILLPLAAMGNLAPLPGGAPTLFAVIVALFIAQTVANIQLWRTSDEFIRQQTLKVGSLTFFIGQGVLLANHDAGHGLLPCGRLSDLGQDCPLTPSWPGRAPCILCLNSTGSQWESTIIR